MVFEEKSKQVAYAMYGGNRVFVEKRIKIDSDLAGELNKIIAVYNNEKESLKRIDNSVLINFAIWLMVDKLNDLDENIALSYLKNGLGVQDEF